MQDTKLLLNLLRQALQSLCSHYVYIFAPVGRKVKNGDVCGSAMLLSIDASFASEGKMAHEEATMTHLPSKIHDVFMSAHKNTTTARQLASTSFSLNSEMSFL